MAMNLKFEIAYTQSDYALNAAWRRRARMFTPQKAMESSDFVNSQKIVIDRKSEGLQMQSMICHIL